MTNFRSQPLVDIQFRTPVSIIIPTFREAPNIPHVLDRLNQLRLSSGLDIETIFVDDNSSDGTVEAVQASGHDWARVLVRREERGLSSAVIHGFRAAQHPVLICMDCDLSHPPEAIPHMILALHAGQSFVLGSRYVPGGKTDDNWGPARWINSAVATFLARPLTSVRDPMSGFFALRKSDFENARDLNPVGYKIALELIVKCQFDNVAEIPIHFSDRLHGTSKLTFVEQLRYLQHLRRLYLYRFSNAMYLAQFLVVGMIGTLVNLAVLTAMRFLGFSASTSLIGGILVSVCTNFAMNRRFTFSYAREQGVTRQFLGFATTAAVGAAVNFVVATLVFRSIEGTGPFALQLAALAGIACGMGFNFMGSRYLVFRKRFLRN